MEKQQGVVHYIEEERAKGKSDQDITHDLLNNGWQMDIIQSAMHGAPIKRRDLEPILDIRKQPIRRIIIFGGIVLLILCLLAAFA